MKKKIDLLKRQRRQFMHKKKREKKLLIQFPTVNKVIQAVLTGVFFSILYGIALPKIKEELTIEAGSRLPEISSFLLEEYNAGACYAKAWKDLPAFHAIGDYDVKILLRENVYHTVLHVTDTIPPEVITKNAQIYKNMILEPMDFIESMKDETNIKAEFEEEPDFSLPGEQEVKIAAVDEGGNVTVESAKLLIIEDLKPPVIEGVRELTTVVGGSVSYKKNVTVSDDYDEHVTLEIDSGSVDLNTVGTYPVIYRARDEVGNLTEKKTVLHVKPASVETATEEMVNKKADEILAGILKDGMSPYEKANAIFNWVYKNVGWSDKTPKTNWIQGAYRGLFNRRGDCFVYAFTSKCLLTRAGIANMDIGFSTARRTHYWNLIDLGEGWHHFDATRRTDGRSFFYCHDADIRAYSDSHNGSHAYDASKYPKIQ